MSTFNSYGEMFRSRLLPERSRIEFHYGPNDDSSVLFIPFYENPKITESQSANYSDYDVVGRAGTLYAYTGAKSRKLKVEMTFTLPHLAMHEMGIDRFMRVFKGESKKEQKLLFTKRTHWDPIPPVGSPNKSLSTAVERMYWQLRIDDGEKSVEQLRNSGNLTRSDERRLLRDEMGMSLRLERGGFIKHEVIDTLLFFIALLRTSVTNNATNPIVGPPLLRLNFGTMYQDIPCVCKSYNIGWDEGDGFDLETLTPRKIKIGLQLEEVRVGNFSQYEPAKATSRDNLPGWESAIDGAHTTDPLPLNGFWQGS